MRDMNDRAMPKAANPISPEDPVLLRKASAIGWLTINRTLDCNAIDGTARDLFIRLLDEAEADSDLRVLVIGGAGGAAFSVGTDVNELAQLTPAEAENFATAMARLYDRLAKSRLVTIAAIAGPCIGAGLELALHCDIRVARQDAQVGFPGVALGVPPQGSTIARLVGLAGGGPSAFLMLTGGVVSAERAFMLGLVTNIFETHAFARQVEEAALHMAGLPAVTLTEIKAQLHKVLSGNIAGAIADAPAIYRRCFEHGEASQKLRAFYGKPAADASVH